MVDFRGKTSNEERKQGEALIKNSGTRPKTNIDKVLQQLGDIQRKIKDNLRRIEISVNLHPNDKRKSEEKIAKLRTSEQGLLKRLDTLNHQPNDCHPSWEI